MALQPFVGPWPLFQFLSPVHSRYDSSDGGSASRKACYLHTEQHKENKRTQTSMSQVGFEPTTPAFERAKTVHDLDRVATVISRNNYTLIIIPFNNPFLYITATSHISITLNLS
jgi:hypothetical protein